MLAALWLNPPLLLLVVLVSRLIPLSEAYHPLTFLRFFAQRLAAKVNPDPNRAAGQLLISGTLALLVAWLPFAALLLSIQHFSELPWLIDALVLYGCLDWQTHVSRARHIQRDLQRGQLTLAREQMASLVLRRTDNLTAMGLSKAGIESLMLRSSSQVVATLLWFLVGGGIAALSYRLLVELHQQWNSKLPEFRYFGRPAALLLALLSAPALLLSCISLALSYGIRRCVRLCRQRPQHTAALPYYLLCCTSAALRRNLAGPLYYRQQKHQRSRINQGQEPDATDLGRALTLTKHCHNSVSLIATVITLLQLVWLLGR